MESSNWFSQNQGAKIKMKKERFKMKRGREIIPTPKPLKPPPTKPEVIVPPGFILGKDIPIEALNHHAIFVTPGGSPGCFLGHLNRNDPTEIDNWLRNEQDRAEYQFIGLRSGALIYDTFLRDNQPYKILTDRRLILPETMRNYYDVRTNESSTDIELTRHFFGTTYEELDEFLQAFNAVINFKSPGELYKHARITSSTKQSNSCDLTSIHIPKSFPFICFGNTQEFGGHISLSGFYKHLAFLCYNRRGGFVNVLIDNGAKPEVIDQMRRAGHEDALLDLGRVKYQSRHMREERPTRFF
jgi:hypothetical protein